jgi:hypothetical protein
MSKSQRTKGASYEREVCQVLSQATGQKVQRNIGQARDGGTEIPLGDYLFECKRRKTLGTIEKWLKQASNARKTDDQVAAVIARSDGGKSLVIITLDDFLTVTGLNHKQIRGFTDASRT